jgi:hypothetical protein
MIRAEIRNEEVWWLEVTEHSKAKKEPKSSGV